MNDFMEVVLENDKFSPNLQLADPDLALRYRELNTRHIWIDDDISFENCQFLLRYIQYLNREESHDKTEITIHIFSYGGEMPVMFTLYNLIKNSKIPIHTINEGICHSAAFMIFLAGHRRSMSPNAHFVAHEGSSAGAGNYKETKARMERYAREVETMKDIICKETNIPKETLEERFDRDSDWYIGYEEASSLGVITV
ncbi:ATP-dependent Clp protease proteolytic subunit [Massilibacteroides sp.]|uniref:ATP-dependent Clp protease proteolytic subunit n=1 Tax=Massilibacteroides sp. TaxID=2034766 RepID=UPI002621415D|nr:ATP-dependent Clp protease proteolytic subunit [Massilibacteroides sp.]MDD4516357.1 ATP-dependent Clp protease proteolytic subunit [Massilibacteroides sp.]